MILDILSKILPNILDKIPDAGEKERVEKEIKELLIQTQHEQLMAQHTTNTQEAKHKSIFVAGWRPFIGWVCGLSLMYGFLIHPLLSPFVTNLPQTEPQLLINLIFGMLGLSGMRSFEKTKQVSTESFK